MISAVAGQARQAGSAGRQRSRPLRAKMARPIRRAGRWLRKLQRRARSRLWPHNFATYYDKIAGGDMVWPCSRKGLNMKVNRRNENGSLEVYISLNLIGLKLSVPPNDRRVKINPALWSTSPAHATVAYSKVFSSYSELHRASIRLNEALHAMEGSNMWICGLPTRDRGAILIRNTCELHGLLTEMQSRLPGGLDQRTEQEHKLHISVSNPFRHYG